MQNYNLSYVTNPIKNYDIRLFNNLLGSKSGFKAHEILQFSWLKKNGYTALRGVGVGGTNPVIALTDAQHINVNRLQRLAGLMGDTIKNMSPYEVMNKNLDILIEIGVPVDKVDELRPLVIEFIDNLDNLKGAL